MSIAKTVREHVLLALVYWTIGLAGDYWFEGVFMLVFPIAMLHCLALLIRAITTPTRWHYWLGFMSVCFVAGSGLAVLMYFSGFGD